MASVPVCDPISCGRRDSCSSFAPQLGPVLARKFDVLVAAVSERRGSDRPHCSQLERGVVVGDRRHSGIVSTAISKEDQTIFDMHVLLTLLSDFERRRTERQGGIVGRRIDLVSLLRLVCLTPRSSEGL